MHIVILGNGIAGITCARHIRKRSNHRITVISGETEHFFSRTALMYIYMGHMTYDHIKPYEDHFWAKNRIDLVRAWISRVDPAAGKLTASDGREFAYDKLVIASGSISNRFGWPGQDLPGVQGLYSYQDLELLEENTRAAGGGGGNGGASAGGGASSGGGASASSGNGGGASGSGGGAGASARSHASNGRPATSASASSHASNGRPATSVERAVIVGGADRH